MPAKAQEATGARWNTTDVMVQRLGPCSTVSQKVSFSIKNIIVGSKFASNRAGSEARSVLSQVKAFAPGSAAIIPIECACSNGATYHKRAV
jgi:hypothetical protein